MEETWSPEPVKAWRYWRVGQREWDFDEQRWTWKLTGDVEVWDTATKTAGVHRGETPDFTRYGHSPEPFVHTSPHWECLCGINAVKALTSSDLNARGAEIYSVGFNGAYSNFGVRPIAVSPVALSGVVDEYDLGYRAESVTIIGPITIIGGTDEMARIVGETYGVAAYAEPWDGPLARALLVEEEERNARDGHRETDSSDHRGTGTGQATRASERTRKNWIGKDWMEGPLGFLAFLGSAVVVALAVSLFIAWVGGDFDLDKILAVKAPWMK